MEYIKKLIDIKESEKRNIDNLDEILKLIEQSDIIKENISLKNKIEENKKNIDELQSKLKLLNEENQKLQLSLYEQIMDEKLSILKLTKDKLDLYFKNEKNKTGNKISEFDFNLKSRIASLRSLIERELKDEADSFNKKLEDIQIKVNESIKNKYEKLSEEERKIYEEIKTGIDDFSKSKLDDAVIKKRIENNKLEMKIGLKWFNVLGIIIVIIGVGALAFYVKSHVNEYIKGIFTGLLGILFLITGEFFYFKKKHYVFGKGLIGGGIGILYSSLFYSYFLLNILSQETALMLSVLITLAAITLAIVNNSKTIISLGLVGGYLPFIAYIIAEKGLQNDQFYYAMVYLFIINALVLIISLFKHWSVSNFLSFVLNIPALIYLAFWSSNKNISLIYVVLTYLMYILIILLYPFKHKTRLKIPDIILLALSTTTSAIIIYILIEAMGITYLRGFLAAVFCIIYFVLGFLTKKILYTEKNTMLLFYITALTFAILMIPFQFGNAEYKSLITFGWLVEGLFLIIFGYKREIKIIEKAGWASFVLCLIYFYFFDFVEALTSGISDYFNLKYLFLSSGIISLMIIFQLDINRNKIFINSFRAKFSNMVKYFAIINLYVFLMFTTQYYFDKFIHYNDYQLLTFFRFLLASFVSLVLGYSLKRLQILQDKAVNIITIILYILGDIIYFISLFIINLNLMQPPQAIVEIIIYYSTFVVMIIYNAVFLMNLRYLVVKLLKHLNKMEFYPVIMGASLIVTLSIIIGIQLYNYYIHLTLSIIYIVLAILFILYGFMRKYVYIRYMGLAVTLLSLGKLFFFDLHLFSSGLKSLASPEGIIATFSYGLLLIGISFIYQRINLRISDKSGLLKSKNKNNKD